MAFIMYLDENDFRKKQRALKRYFTKTYKYMIFKFFPELKKGGKVEGKYELELPIDERVKYVYGPIKVLFTISNDVAVLENIVPDGFLIDCYERDLPVYKGIPYNSKKALAKIKIAERLI